MAFLVENRPGAPLMPGLGEVRVYFGSQQYNPITNSSSREQFSPFIIVREPEDFFATPFGRPLRDRATGLTSQPSIGVLDVFIRGGEIRSPSDGVVEIEQAETYRPDGDGHLRPVSGTEMWRSSIWFRFRMPPLE